MPRYFIELSYKGTAYAGFQAQDNANTIQAEVSKALATYFRHDFLLTGSSRTDSGVHAAQNWFHFDDEQIIDPGTASKAVYRLNAILPGDIVIKRINRVGNEAHCRFDAISRTYLYTIYHLKEPFLADRAWFYPYPLDVQALQEVAGMLKGHSNFRSFSKKNTQVSHFDCMISESTWEYHGRTLMFTVTGNRFLRGMVRALVATMLKAGRGKITSADFRRIIEMKNPVETDFSAPAKGLLLQRVSFPENIFLPPPLN